MGVDSVINVADGAYIPEALGTFNPWETDVVIDGTDGSQFAPGVESDDILKVFRMDLSRNMNYTYMMPMNDYPVETLMFMTSADQMLNMTANPANSVYQIMIDGTTNLTTSFKAPVVATKGHYLGFSPNAISSVPLLVD